MSNEYWISWVVPGTETGPDPIVVNLQENIIDHLVATGVATGVKAKAVSKKLVSGWFSIALSSPCYSPGHNWGVWSVFQSEKTPLGVREEVLDFIGPFQNEDSFFLQNEGEVSSSCLPIGFRADAISPELRKGVQTTKEWVAELFQSKKGEPKP